MPRARFGRARELCREQCARTVEPMFCMRAARPCAVSGQDGVPFERKRNLSCVLDPCHSFKRGRVEYMIVCVCVSRHGARVALACEGGVSLLFLERWVLKTISRFGIRQLVLDRPGSQINIPCAVSPPPLAQRSVRLIRSLRAHPVWRRKPHPHTVFSRGCQQPIP